MGVRVTCLCPGPVSTEFQIRAGITQSAPNRLIDVSAAKVAEAGYRGLMRGKRVVVPGLIPKLLFALVPRIVPKSFLLAAARSAAGGAARKRLKQASLKREP